MSNYNNLKTAIDANIKQNGNQEITGPILNSVLNQMVNILGTGYQFAGVATLAPATDPGTPDAKVFYIANGKGTYEKFGGINVTEDDVVVLYWDSSWHKVSTGIASDQKLSELFEDTQVDFSINDEEGYKIVEFTGGHIRTKKFNSAEFSELCTVIRRYVGKRISILGDSISTFGAPSATNQYGTYCYSYYPAASCRYSQDGVDSIAFDVNNTYWMKLITTTGMILGINDSYRGTRVSGTSNAFNLQTRIDHLGENGTPDVILVYGGTNDAGGNVTIGTFNTENPVDYTEEQIAELPIATFADAYRTMLIRLMKTYPLSEIIVILPTFTSSYYAITNLDLYVEVIKEACDFFGIKYIDARCTGINVYNKESYLVDGIHPNIAGMNLLFQKIYKQLIFN